MSLAEEGNLNEIKQCIIHSAVLCFREETQQLSYVTNWRVTQLVTRPSLLRFSWVTLIKEKSRARGTMRASASIFITFIRLMLNNLLHRLKIKAGQERQEHRGIKGKKLQKTTRQVNAPGRAPRLVGNCLVYVYQTVFTFMF